MRKWGMIGLVSLSACAGRVETVQYQEPQDPGVAAPTDGPTVDRNPQGFAYPTDQIGNAVGTRVPNLGFVGFAAHDTASMVDTSGVMQQIHLANYYDPLGLSGIKLIHISVQTRWCGPSNQETSLLSGFDFSTSARVAPGLAADLASAGVVFIDLIVDGFTPGVSATVDDLRGWAADHQTNFTIGLAPNNDEFGSLSLQAALPLNIEIDARSMELLAIGVGFDSDMKTTEKKWLQWVASHPPMTALPSH